jgi:DNA mismatch repair protein MutL
MTDIIHLLPDSVANQIAAGEVVDRPSSVVKELVENSIDAGATDIAVIIKDSGKTLIQVVDNGKGMSETDARMAFERHATSKINSAADLYSLQTMGFRGQALASIAAIAQIDLRTRREGDEYRIVIRDNGKGFDPGLIGADDGSHIGIANVRSRLEQMCGGWLDIDSKPGEGTTITMHIPA